MMAEDEKEKGTGGKDEKDYELGWVDHAYSFVGYIRRMFVRGGSCASIHVDVGLKMARVEVDLARSRQCLYT